MRELLEALFGQDKAVANARAAATELSRRRVERDEIDLYLEALRPGAALPSVATDGWAGAPVRAAD